jgi:hypothetical protein
MTDPIHDLRRELVAATRREATRSAQASAASRRRLPGRFGRRVVVLVAVLVLACGGVVAATQLFGPPVRPGPVVLGGPRSGSVVLVPLRVADPSGGYPWGIRIYTPRRGRSAPGAQLTCVQFGRVLDDRLGVLGEDGAFANDGLFHELPVEPTADCVRAASFTSYPGYVPASAFIGHGACTPTPTRTGVTPRAGRRSTHYSRTCTTAELRLVVFGIAPSGTRFVRLSTSVRAFTQKPGPADRGAFLFVLSDSGENPRPPQLRVTFQP